jgi:predicted RNA-binding protein with PUA-like domain
MNKKHYWLMKTEPSVFSIDDLKANSFSEWEGVRNFQARNFMRDGMKVGDLALFYHSNANPSGVAGICRIVEENHPDYTAWDTKSPYFDPKASPENPIWAMVKVEFVEKFPHFIPLAELKNYPQLKGLKILEKGSRLSITTVDKSHFEFISALGNTKFQ